MHLNRRNLSGLNPPQTMYLLDTNRVNVEKQQDMEGDRGERGRGERGREREGGGKKKERKKRERKRKKKRKG